MLAAAGVAGIGAPAAAADKPNILFIMGDDIGWMQPSIYHRGLMVGETPNIDRIGREGAMMVDYPFEQNVGIQQKSAMSMGGSLGAPSTAYQYDWNMLPIGQELWLKHLMTFKAFPPLQPAETWNLGQVMEEVKKATAGHPSD